MTGMTPADSDTEIAPPSPYKALCDGPPALCDDFARFAARVEAAAELAGKRSTVAVR